MIFIATEETTADGYTKYYITTNMTLIVFVLVKTYITMKMICKKKLNKLYKMATVCI